MTRMDASATVVARLSTQEVTARRLADLLAERDRTRAAPTFAADGLYLAGATYDARFGLPPTVRAVTLAAA